MKAVYSSPNGCAHVLDVPVPELKPGQVRIAAACSLVSGGTERHYAARAATAGTSVALGYCTSGRILEVAPGVTGFTAGDAVIAMGWGYAVHAEEVCVPWRLCAKIPRGLGFDTAVFAGLMATAVHAHDRAGAAAHQPTLVVGAGLVGQLVARVAVAHGARTWGADGRVERLAYLPDHAVGVPIAVGEGDRRLVEWLDGTTPRVVYMCGSGESTGAWRAVSEALAAPADRGVRAVIVCVGRLAAHVDLSADLGNVDIRISSRCGVGYRDDDYVHGRVTYDAPPGEATVDANLLRSLTLIASGRAEVSRLLTHSFPVRDARRAYQALEDAPTMAIVLRYGQ